MTNQDEMQRIRNGVAISPNLMTAAVAQLGHKPGDKYTNGIHMYRLHQKLKPNSQRAHYEFEPRWNSKIID